MHKTSASGLALFAALAASLPATLSHPAAAANLDLSGAWSYVSGQSNSGVAGAAVPIGDFNNDGYPDIAVSAGGWVPAGDTVRRGAVLIFKGSATGFPSSPSHIVLAHLSGSATGGDAFGFSIAAAGDINSDGYDDVVIGAPYWDGYRGRTFLAYGRSTTTQTITTDWSHQEFPTGNSSDYFGWSVSGNVDINCDGSSDVLVSTHYFDGVGAPYAGKVYAFYGSTSGLSTTGANWSYQGNGGFFGIEVAGVGNVNGDGWWDQENEWQFHPCEDFVVGASGYNYDAGRVYHFRGSQSGPTLAGTATYSTGGTNYGFGLERAGDVNLDGNEDVLVHSPNYDATSMTDSGAVWIVYGPSTGIGTRLEPDAQQTLSSFGHMAAAAGDINGDGYPDVIVGQPRWDRSGGWTGNDEGKLHIFLGSSSGLTTTPSHSQYYNPSGSAPGGYLRLGEVVGSAGDMDGDGLDEVLLGTPSWDAPNNNGKVWGVNYVP